jgi:hypothetical protein
MILLIFVAYLDIRVARWKVCVGGRARNVLTEHHEASDHSGGCSRK